MSTLSPWFTCTAGTKKSHQSKPRTQTTPNAGERVVQQELSFVVGGNAKWYSLVASYNFKCTLTVGTSKCTPWNLPQKVENLRPRRNLHTSVYRSFIRDCQNLETAKMPFGR